MQCSAGLMLAKRSAPISVQEAHFQACCRWAWSPLGPPRRQAGYCQKRQVYLISPWRCFPVASMAFPPARQKLSSKVWLYFSSIFDYRDGLIHYPWVRSTSPFISYLKISCSSPLMCFLKCIIYFRELRGRLHVSSEWIQNAFDAIHFSYVLYYSCLKIYLEDIT